MAPGIYEHTGDKAAAIRDENGRVLRTFPTIDAQTPDIDVCQYSVSARSDSNARAERYR